MPRPKTRTKTEAHGFMTELGIEVIHFKTKCKIFLIVITHNKLNINDFQLKNQKVKKNTIKDQ